ncbi:LmeA family phospholipid-binding protein [Microbacterium paraoxydans]|uniref:LmeA family phospholipid-binding protein n=1 Tax=Microbacterium paraoxydans TaxID=199592 RepID=UPI003D74AE66
MSDDNPTLPYPKPSDEHPTLVVPDPADGRGGAVRRRRRWPWVVLIVVVVLAALLVAAEFVARAVLPGVVRSIVIEQLDLPADQQLDVETEGILLPQLLAGRLDTLRLSTDAVTLQGITGAADVTATGVPLRGGDLDGADGTIRIDQEQFTALLADSELPVDTVEFAAPNATLGGSFDVLGTEVPVSVTLTPGAVEGDLELTPVAASIGGVDIDLDSVGSSLGSLGDGITQPRRVCIADQLPAGLTLTGVEIVDDQAVIDIDVDGAIVTDEALQEKGSCDR